MLREKRLRLLSLGELALVDHTGRADESLATRPRKLALLTVLALSQRPLTRDALVGMFWGEQDVSLAEGTPLDVDVSELARAFNAGDHPRVTQLYRGSFLESVHISGSDTFERWRERERQRLELLFVRSASVHCEILVRTGRWEQCASLAARWLDVAPTSADAAVHLLTALSAPGTREAGLRALAQYEQLARRLADDYVLAPERSVTLLAESIREQAHQTLETRIKTPGVPQRIPTLPPPLPVEFAAQRYPQERWLAAVALALAILALVIVVVRP